MHCERAEEIKDMAKSRTFLKRSFIYIRPLLSTSMIFLQVTAHPSSQNNLLVCYETDWTKGGNILSSQIFYTYICWGVYLRPSNLGQCKYVLKPPISVHFLDISHRSSVAFHLSVSLFKISLTISY